MEIVNVEDAQTQLSRLIERVLSGEEIFIARGGHPVARLTRVAREPRRPGRLKCRIVISADLDAPLPESMAAAFRGEAAPSLRHGTSTTEY